MSKIERETSAPLDRPILTAIADCRPGYVLPTGIFKCVKILQNRVVKDNLSLLVVELRARNNVSVPLVAWDQKVSTLESVLIPCKDVSRFQKTPATVELHYTSRSSVEEIFETVDEIDEQEVQVLTELNQLNWHSLSPIRLENLKTITAERSTFGGLFRTLISDGQRNILLRTPNRMDLKVGETITVVRPAIKIEGSQIVLAMDHNNCEIFRSSEPLVAAAEVERLVKLPLLRKSS
ncbi:hypothetical protein QR680_014241 [Steinernema hermaphroditum]|uniref:Uncharacterized protein n=1 Tax=Steinernema hermaphroditum TaxID=289476 RepID=A0AA39M3W1_9BILA|nr:hypothetical protein QR680_014241 [Steinernema hermaphroditum]